MGRLPGRLFFLLLIAEVVFGLANECLLLLEGCTPRLDAIVSFAFLDAKTSSTVLVFMTRRDEGSFGVLISTLSETIFFFFFHRCSSAQVRRLPSNLLFLRWPLIRLKACVI